MTLNTFTTLTDLENSLDNEQPLAFALLGDKSERYQFVQKILVKFCYLTLSNKEKGIVIRFLLKITGYSRQQITRLVKSTAKPLPRLNHVRSPIGERKKLQPDGKPSYIRIDTVHQGDLDKTKGVYHINVVDEVTQFEIVCSVEKISELYLMPALTQILESFPFQVLGFHSDNGSEYINKQVAALLEKLYIEFTKSRSRHSNDNALAESKNASIVRKTFGYPHIAQKCVSQINAFNKQLLNPYINYHRPCFFAETHSDTKGNQNKCITIRI